MTSAFARPRQTIAMILGVLALMGGLVIHKGAATNERTVAAHGSLPSEVPQSAAAHSSQSSDSSVVEVLSNQILFRNSAIHLRPGLWSSDGQSVLFHRLTDRHTQAALDPSTGYSYSVGIYELWTYSRKDGTQTKISDNAFNGEWLSDGQQVRYFSYEADSQSVQGQTTSLVDRTITEVVGSQALWLDYLPGGETIFARNKQIFVQNANGTLSPWLNATLDDPIQDHFWVAPDGSGIIISNGSRLEWVSRSGEQIELAKDYQPGHDVAWSPNSQSILYATLSTELAEIRRYDISTQSSTVLVTAKEWNEEFLSLAWSPNGELITFVRQQRRSEEPASLWVIRSQDVMAQQQLSEDVISAYWSPDGAELLYQKASDPNTVGILTVQQ